MNEPAELELQIHHVGRKYAVDLLFTNPKSHAFIRPLADKNVVVQFDLEQLLAASLDSDRYGELLGEMLFRDTQLQQAFGQARAVAASARLPLRLRLALSPDAADLHTLRWETLRFPGEPTALAMSSQLRFSRLLASADWRLVTLPRQDALRALVVIAAPDGLPRHLAPIDVVREQRQAIKALSDVVTTVLAAPGHASLKLISDELRKGYNLFYLLAHGALIKDEPWLFLDDGGGKMVAVAAEDLAFALRDLDQRPQLAFLASCQSAGDGSAPMRVALGPHMVMAGVPSVVAMQGNIEQNTNIAFIECFFRELGSDGMVERAMALARQAVADRDDWWVPALFSRMRGERIWYEPGFEGGDTFDKWPALRSQIASGRCTPIIGPGLIESYLGSTRQIAQKLAERHNFPLAPFARDDLPQVAQFLAVKHDLAFMRETLSKAFRATRVHTGASNAVPQDKSSAHLARAGMERRIHDQYEPHRVLASLPFPIYLTANPDTNLVDALREAGRTPNVLVCPWYLDRNLATSEALKVEPPTPERPLVYYLFGTFEDEKSLVLTEDDYFRYLIGVTRNHDLLPLPVGRALSSNALLLLGFGLEDWNFRVLFQSLMNLFSSQLRADYIHIAVQLDPQEDRAINPNAARDYLKNYFGPKAARQYQTEFSIYWGKSDDFVRDLALHWVADESAL